MKVLVITDVLERDLERHRIATSAYNAALDRMSALSRERPLASGDLSEVFDAEAELSSARISLCMSIHSTSTFLTCEVDAVAVRYLDPPTLTPAVKALVGGRDPG